MVFGNIITSTGQKIKLIGTKINGTLNHSFASISFEQQFKNESSETQDCKLIVNGGMNFIVYNVRIVVGEKTMKFVIREIEEAQASHQQSLQHGYTSSIVTTESSDALKFEIGNVAAGESLKVLIDCSFTASLEGNDGLLFKLPFDKQFAGSDVDCNLQLFMQSKIKSITATSGTVKFSAEDDGENGKLSILGKIDKQLSLTIKLEEEITDSTICAKIDSETFIGVAITPSFDEKEAAAATKAEVILVIDCSGSMSGSPIKTATETLSIFLRSLKPGSLFNVVRFGSTFEAMYPTSVEYTRENFEDALQKVSIMSADLGGTDLLSPLTDIFSWPVRSGFVRQIFVLTDGEVEDQSECLSLATKHRSSCRVFGLGIGDSVDRGFIEELAKTSAGEPAFVSKSADVPRIVLGQLSSALRGAVTEVQLHIEGTEAIEVAPFPIPPLFSNSLTHLFVKVNAALEEPAVLVTGKAGDGDFESAVACVDAPQIRLDKQFAFFNIRDLEESLTMIKDKEARDAVRRNTIAQSSRYGIVSQFTAMWSVVDGDSTPNIQQQQQTVTEKPIEQMQAMNSRQMRGQASYSRNTAGYVASTTQQNAWGSSQDAWGFSENYSCMVPEIDHDHECLAFSSSALNRGGPLSPDDFMVCEFSCAAPMPVPADRMDGDSSGFFSRIANFFSRKQKAQTETNKKSLSQKKKELKYSLIELLGLQDFDGFWPAETLSIIRKFAKGVPKMDGAEFMDDRVRATVLALAILRLRESAQQEVWQLVADKAMEWLKGVSAETDWNAVIETVFKSLSI